MLEFSETDARLHNLHPVRELDADGDLLADVCHFVGRVLERMSDRIMHPALLTNLLRLSLNRLVFFRASSDRDGVNFLMRLAVPFVESREVRSSSARLLPTGRKNSVLCAEFLYRDILREALSLVQKPKALKIFTTVYHLSHS